MPPRNRCTSRSSSISNPQLITDDSRAPNFSITVLCTSNLSFIFLLSLSVTTCISYDFSLKTQRKLVVLLVVRDVHVEISSHSRLSYSHRFLKSRSFNVFVSMSRLPRTSLPSRNPIANPYAPFGRGRVVADRSCIAPISLVYRSYIDRISLQTVVALSIPRVPRLSWSVVSRRVYIL